MVDQRLVDYIKTELARGVSLEHIRQILMETGWQENDVNDAIGFVQQPVVQQLVQQPVQIEQTVKIVKKKTTKHRKSTGKISKKKTTKVPKKARISLVKQVVEQSVQEPVVEKVVVQAFQTPVKNTIIQNPDENTVVQKPIAQVQTTPVVKTAQYDNTNIANKSVVKEQSSKLKIFSSSLLSLSNGVKSKKFIMVLGIMIAILIIVGVVTVFVFGSSPSAKFTQESDDMLKDLEAAVQAENVNNVVQPVQQVQEPVEIPVQESVQSIPEPVPQNIPVTTGQSVNCGIDMDCLIQLSQSCELGFATDDIVNDGGTSNVQYKLLGMDGVNCVLRVTRNDGVSGECVNDPFMITDMLIRWSNDIYSSDDNILGNCQGDYFN
ncbi:MAG: hypothetical protein V1870_03760 [Candidatus Aenigmatarchaeota archaeon]